MTLGQKVKLAREKRGMTQRDLAKKADISNGYVSIIENGGEGANHGMVQLTRISRALEIPLMWLVDESEPEPNWDEPTADLGEGEPAA